MQDVTESNGQQEDHNSALPKRFRMIISWIIVLILIAFGSSALYRLFTFSEPEERYWENLFENQFPVVVGIPMAALGALFITLILRVSSGPLEFEIGVLKFKGGAAPIVFWIICFLSFVLSISMLWQN